MPIRFRKSVKLGGGVRLNVGKTGGSISVGGRGGRYTVHSSGRRTASVGIPGTGLGYVSSSGGGRGRRSASSGGSRGLPVPQTLTGLSAASALPKPGLFAGAAEKAYHKAVLLYFAGNKAGAAAAFESVLAVDPTITSAHLFASISMGPDDSDAAQIAHLEAAVASEGPFPDKFMAKYLPDHMVSMELSAKITDSISTMIPVNPVGATLILAEAYQASDRIDEATGLVAQLHEVDPADRAVRLSLADLLFADADYDGVVETTKGMTNTDDLGVALLHLRGAALYALGHQTAALDTFRDALAKTANRDPGLLMDVRYDRAFAFEAAGQKAKARADFERLYAADPSYRDVRDRLASM